MLSYRHSYHAGNHADVLKHIVLSLCLESLKSKPKPFIYLDTHAGAGRYLLQSEHAEKTGEYLAGIARIWQQANPPAELAAYLSVLKQFNPSGQLKYYPGSPLIAKQMLRENDKLLLTELHSSDYPLLRQEFNKDRRATVSRSDGFKQLKSQLPPVCRRGIMLIDPSYELKTDYQAVVQAIKAGYQRFATGIYAIWYPVVSRTQTQRMIQALTDSGIRRILQIELGIRPDNTQKGMTASGMIVINPPWQLEQKMQAVLPWLYQTLVPEQIGHYLVNTLVPE